MTEEPKPGSGGRPWGCLYFDADHVEAAKKVKELEPEVYAWALQPIGDLPDDLTKKYWKRVADLLPGSTLIDHSNVLMELRQLARPLSQEQAETLRKLDEMNKLHTERRRLKDLQAEKENKHK